MKTITWNGPIDSAELLDCVGDYFAHVPDICDLVAAVKDKKFGLGMIWNSTDFDKIRDSLEHFPKTWIIGQVRDRLFECVERMKAEGER